MDEKISLKKDSTTDFPNSILEFSVRLLHEYGNYHWIPRMLVEILELDGAALALNQGSQYIVHYFALTEGEIGSIEMATEHLQCLQKIQGNSSGGGDGLCRSISCPAQPWARDIGNKDDEMRICFPMEDHKGIIIACGKKDRNNATTLEALESLAKAISKNLDADKVGRKARIAVVPSEGVAQLWSEMLAGLSHDLRTPMACIKGYATTLLRKDVSWDITTQKEFLNIIVEETDHIENLITKLLDSSTLSWKGEVELNREVFSIPHIVNKIIKDPSYRYKHHRFTVLFAAEFPTMYVDPIRIEQVIRNLIENAIKYSAESTAIEISGEVLPGEVIVSVTDQGIGIGEEHLNHLFEKFFRINDGIHEQQKGMGLGLPLAQQIITSHGGKIWAKSKLNEGTTFYFSLPYGAPS